jgi:ketosteroid isomerase-like protein
MADAVDWLYAYRAGDIDALLKMLAEDAVIHCGCGTMKTVPEEMQRLREYPASALDKPAPVTRRKRNFVHHTRWRS